MITQNDFREEAHTVIPVEKQGETIRKLYTVSKEIAEEWGESADVLLENKEALYSVFGDISCLLIDPVAYLHGACDMFALYLANRCNYSIRAYCIERESMKPFLTHAVCYATLDGQTQWIDIRGITDDENEMYAPFVEDERQALSYGGVAVIRDYEGADSIERFLADVVDDNRDIPAFTNEIEGMLYETSDLVYDCFFPF